MALTKKTSLGTITINPSVIAREVREAATPVKEKMFFATDKGKLVASPMKISSADLSSNMIVEETGNRINVTVHIIMSFGSSIKTVTETIFDGIENSMRALFPQKGGNIKIKIVGVKSKKVAPRDIEVVREYEASRQG